jgi:hypothetical protein
MRNMVFTPIGGKIQPYEFTRSDGFRVQREHVIADQE